MNYLKVIRNHWKKTTFVAFATAYGAKYYKDKYEISKIMRHYCEEAVKYGDAVIDPITPPKTVIVLLNPAADKRTAEKNYKEYCEPILHLAGYLVEVVQTDSAGHARRYVEEELSKLPHAIIVAGGDGTLSETVTGLLRRADKQLCPIGILPLGKTNEVVSKLFSDSKRNNVEEVKLLANTAIAVVRGKVEKKDVIQIEPLQTEEQEQDLKNEKPKPIYAMGSLQWGAFRDVKSLTDKYWYVGPLREYVAPLFNAFGDRLTWECKTKLIYTPPCSGCKNCRTQSQQVPEFNKRWWSVFIPRYKLGQQPSEQDFSKIVNDECEKHHELEIRPSEIILETNHKNNPYPKLTLRVKDEIKSSLDFISESWSRTRTKEIGTKKLLEGRTVTLLPENTEDEKEKFFYIDNEPFEIRPIKVSVIPNAVNVYVL